MNTGNVMFWEFIYQNKQRTLRCSPLIYHTVNFFFLISLTIAHIISFSLTRFLTNSPIMYKMFFYFHCKRYSRSVVYCFSRFNDERLSCYMSVLKMEMYVIKLKENLTALNDILLSRICVWNRYVIMRSMYMYSQITI